MDGELDIGEPHCEACGTVMHAVDAGYQCRGCGHTIDVPWVERGRPTGADDLPGISGGRRDGGVR